MRPPRALDLYAGAGGMSVGLQRAGFEVTAVDINPQPHHRGGRFIQADCLEALLDLEFLRSFDFIHALAALPGVQLAPPPLCRQGLPRPDPGDAGLPAGVRGALLNRERGGRPAGLLRLPDDALRHDVRVADAGRARRDQETPPFRDELLDPAPAGEIRRHRLFETSFSIPLRPACQHGYVSRESLSVNGSGLDSNKERWAVRTRCSCPTACDCEVPGSLGSNECPEHNLNPRPALDCPVHGERPYASTSRRVLTVTGHSYHTTDTKPDSRPERRKVLCVAGGKRMSGGMMTPQGTLKRRAMSVTGNTAQTNVERNQVRKTFSIADARAAMQIDWMPMKSLSQAIPPVYGTWIGKQALAAMGWD